MTVVRLESLTKRFGSVVAVDSIDLSIDSGEFVVLVGPSGSGKTTSLRMIAGLETVSSGSIFIAITMSPTSMPRTAMWRWCFSHMPFIPT